MSENSANLFIGTKMLFGTVMTLGAYNVLRGWELPENEQKETEGYLVEYLDSDNQNHPDYPHYISWSPKKEFENAYRKTDGMNFGLAIEAMKKGLKVARVGWNGKGMFCIYVPGTKNVVFTEGSAYEVALRNYIYEGDIVSEILPHFDMFTINNEGRHAFLPGWLASQSDMAASDWVIVE